MMTLAEQQAIERQDREMLDRTIGSSRGYFGHLVVTETPCETCGKFLRRKSDGSLICMGLH